MPPRWLSAIIVAFWLATTGWLLWHDLLPRWLAGEPPLFHPDFVDEVQQKSASPLRTNWIVERQDKGQTKPSPVFRAWTSVTYDRDKEVYSLKAHLDTSNDLTLRPVTVAKFLRVNSLSSTYRVDRSGRLLGLEANVKVRIEWKLSGLGQLLTPQEPPLQKESSPAPIELKIEGEVRDQQLFTHCSATTQGLDAPVQLDLPPVAVSYTGSVLMPMHPLNHIRGLRLGQSWRQPLVDPLNDALAALTGFSGGVHWINARVLPQPETLKWDDSETSCLVIEYTNDDNETIGRTWVEQDGERVLQQEAILEGSRWIMKREARRSSVRILDSGHD